MPTSLPPPPASRAEAISSAPSPGGVRGRISFATVQLGAFSARPYAEEVLRGFRGRLPARPDAPLRIREVVVQGRRWFRIMAGPFPLDAAESVCRTLSGQGTGCLVRPEPAIWREALKTASARGEPDPIP